MMRKPILAGTLGALAAVAVIAGLLAFEIWPFSEADSSQVRPAVVSETETSLDGSVTSAPENILDVELSVENSVTAEVTRNAVPDDSPETIVPPANTEAPPRGGPEEGSTVQQSLDFVVRDADGNIKQSGSAK